MNGLDAAEQISKRMQVHVVCMGGGQMSLKHSTSASVIQWTVQWVKDTRSGMLSTKAHVDQCGYTDVAAQLELVGQI